MNNVIGTIVVIVLISLAVTGMTLAWRKKVKHAKRFSVILPGNTISPSNTYDSFEVFYVATTMATDPLVRVALPGLSFRAHGFIDLNEHTVDIRPQGEKITQIPASQLVQLHTAQVTIDKAVEKDGLTAISWQAFDTHINEVVEFTSFFRFTNPQENARFIQAFATYYPDITQKEVSS